MAKPALQPRPAQLEPHLACSPYLPNHSLERKRPAPDGEFQVTHMSRVLSCFLSRIRSQPMKDPRG